MKTVKRVRMLNVHLHDVSMDYIVENFREGVILTLHVDMLMKLQKDKEFYDLLPKFDFITCDSQVMFFASHFLGSAVTERVSGSDFFPNFYTKYANDPSVTVFICGGRPGIAALAATKINTKVGRRIIVGTDSPKFDFDHDHDEIERMIKVINESGASTCVVGLTGGRQEKFIMRYRERMPSVKLWLPLGGAIDYESGIFARPPMWARNCGLEWFFRLLDSPRERFHRYLIHEPPFFWLVLKQRFGLYKNPFE